MRGPITNVFQLVLTWAFVDSLMTISGAIAFSYRQQHTVLTEIAPLFAKTVNNHAEAMISDDEALQIMERLEALDQTFGMGVGASRERYELQSKLDTWEAQQHAGEANDNSSWEEECYFDYSDESEGGSDPDPVCFLNGDSTKLVTRHLATDRVAIFGGNPARRRQMVAKKLAPFCSLEQYGTPKDVGPSDTTRLLRKIRNGNFDVVYVWTRFNCHASRHVIRKRCQETGTRFEEVESLAYIQ